MLQVDGIRADEVDAQLGLVNGACRLERQFVLLPVARGDGQCVSHKLLVLFHRCTLDELYGNLCLTLRGLSPDGETIGFALLQADAEETVVGEAGAALTVAWVAEFYVVRTALEGSVVFHLELSKGFPAHEVVGELKRTVLY